MIPSEYYISYLSVLGLLSLTQIIWLVFEVTHDNNLTNKTHKFLVQIDQLPIRSWKNTFFLSNNNNEFRFLDDDNHPCRIHNTERTLHIIGKLKNTSQRQTEFLMFPHFFKYARQNTPS